MLESICKIDKYTQNCLDADNFFSNEQLNFNASLNLLGNMVNYVQKISVELQNKYKNID
ncbi:MAG: hypothetical protein FWD66_08585 [Paludibacter sp.]|nr:hypothetical protein [Paludibacter sp.]